MEKTNKLQTRYSGCERQRERAGGPARVEDPGEQSCAPGVVGREIRSEKGASPPAQPSR